MNMEHVTPELSFESYVHPTAVVIGGVKLGAHSSVWPCAVVRGDCGRITIGEYSSIQDNCSVHTAQDNNVVIGDYVTVGHGAVLHGCTIGNGAVIGMNATVLDGATVGENAIVAAGSVVAPNESVPAGKVVMGVPAKVTRDLRPGEAEANRANAEEYWALAQWNRHLSEFDM